MKTLCLTGATVIAAMVVGCASQPPTELKNARTAYQEAAQCPGAQLAAPDVYEAKKSLDMAERAFADEGDEPETRDIAYVAHRKALVAKSRCNTMISMQQRSEAIAEAERLQQQRQMAMREQLGQTKEQLGQTKEQLERSQEQLESERRARAAAEQRTQDALKRIQGLTTKEDPRGLVMTLSGSVLFASGKSELLPTAQKRIADVVSALKDDRRGITIVGHTDSVGNEDKNQTLSQRRAEAVRTYLIAHGIPEDRVKAEGAGETQPLADNKTADGRANNRRVEIILHGEPGTMQPRQQPGMQQNQPMQQNRPMQQTPQGQPGGGQP